MRQAFSNFHFLLVIFAFVLQATKVSSQQFTTEVSDVAVRCLQAAQSVVASLPEGKMSFRVENRLPHKTNENLFIEGVIYWDFPKVRIEHEQVTQRSIDEKLAKSRFVVIDSELGVSTHCIDAGQVFHSPDHARRIDPHLRLAPWQSWFEFFGEVKLEEVFDLAKFSVRSPTHRFEVQNDRFLIINGDLRSEIVLEKNSCLVRRFDFDTHKGEFEWIQVNGNYFPKSIRFQAKSPKAPTIVIETSAHSNSHGIDQKLFHSSSFDLASVSRVITYRKGQPPVIQRLKSDSKETLRDSIRTLGDMARKVGFAKESR